MSLLLLSTVSLEQYLLAGGLLAATFILFNALDGTNAREYIDPHSGSNDPSPLEISSPIREVFEDGSLPSEGEDDLQPDEEDAYEQGDNVSEQENVFNVEHSEQDDDEYEFREESDLQHEISNCDLLENIHKVFIREIEDLRTEMYRLELYINDLHRKNKKYHKRARRITKETRHISEELRRKLDEPDICEVEQ